MLYAWIKLFFNVSSLYYFSQRNASKGSLLSNTSNSLVTTAVGNYKVILHLTLTRNPLQ